MIEQLFQVLEEQAKPDGLAMIREPELIERLRTTPGWIRKSLRDLEAAGRIRILSRLPFLTLKLVSWSGQCSKSAIPKASSYSFKHLTDKSIAIEGEDRGTGEGEGLLQEILETLGESDPTTFRGALDHYPAATIRSVLERVRATPNEKLRKSRTALFRYLLAQTK